jgi:hypothetical protein
MRKLWNSVLGLCVIGTGLGVSASAQAASAVGPYYAVPSWDQTFPAATRFIVLTNMASQAVLDRETGLVWEQSPGTPTRSWTGAHNHCIQKAVGNRKGWRLPTIQELFSLIDPTVVPPPGPVLPPNHPFSNVQPDNYWSATTFISSGSPAAWTVRFDNGLAGGSPTSSTQSVWCVRGGQGVDAQ